MSAGLEGGPHSTDLREAQVDPVMGWVDYPQNRGVGYPSGYPRSRDRDSGGRTWTAEASSSAESSQNQRNHAGENPIPNPNTGGTDMRQTQEHGDNAGGDESAGSGFNPQDWAQVGGDDRGSKERHYNSRERRNKERAERFERRWQERRAGWERTTEGADGPPPPTAGDDGPSNATDTWSTNGPPSPEHDRPSATGNANCELTD